MTTATWQQQALRWRELGGRRQSTQGEDRSHDPPYLGIGWNQAFGVQFAEGDVNGPAVLAEMAEAV